MSNKTFDIFLNEPDLYKSIDFSSKKVFNKVLEHSCDEGAMRDVEVLAVGLKSVIDDQFLTRFPKVKYILSSTTALDHIKTSRPITVINLDPKEILSVTATAEFSLTLLLSLVRKIPFINPKIVSDRQIYRGMQLSGKTIGIVGFGRIGQHMARYASALGMTYISYDKDDSQSRLDLLLETSDIISIHLPLRPETIGFIGTKEFSRMKRKPYLINSARPQIVDKKALIAALDSDIIQGAAMDFLNYDANHHWDQDLVRFSETKLLMTPHIAGNTHESVQFTANIVIDKFVASVT
jgi:D-3-phosphoglycerate dehydrogenase